MRNRIHRPRLIKPPAWRYLFVSAPEPGSFSQPVSVDSPALAVTLSCLPRSGRETHSTRAQDYAAVPSVFLRLLFVSPCRVLWWQVAIARWWRVAAVVLTTAPPLVFGYSIHNQTAGLGLSEFIESVSHLATEPPLATATTVLSLWRQAFLLLP